MGSNNPQSTNRNRGCPSVERHRCRVHAARCDVRRRPATGNDFFHIRFAITICVAEQRNLAVRGHIKPSLDHAIPTGTLKVGLSQNNRSASSRPSPSVSRSIWMRPSYPRAVRLPSGANRRLLMLESSTGSSRTVKPGVSSQTLVWAELAEVETSQAQINKARKNGHRMGRYWSALMRLAIDECFRHASNGCKTVG